MVLKLIFFFFIVWIIIIFLKFFFSLFFFLFLLRVFFDDNISFVIVGHEVGEVRDLATYDLVSNFQDLCPLVLYKDLSIVTLTITVLS